MRFIAAIVCSLALQSVAGCAAIGHTFGPVSDQENDLVYAGTRYDVAELTGKHRTGGDWDDVARTILWPVVLIDLPFSMVIDTLLLPYTVPESRHRQSSNGK